MAVVSVKLVSEKMIVEKTEIDGIAKSFNELYIQAYYEYVPLVIKYCGILDFDKCATEHEIEIVLDNLLNFAGHEYIDDAFKLLCNKYISKYPDMVQEYINYYKQDIEEH